MEKIYILGKDGQYEEASVIDEEIKEQIKKENERKRKRKQRRRRRDGAVQEDKGEADELASDDLHGGGEDPMV